MALVPVGEMSPTPGGATPISPWAGWRTSVSWLLIVAVPVWFWFSPLNLPAPAKHALAISAFMILGWAFQAMDAGLTGLIGCYLFWALGVVKIGVAFSGFADDAPWFLVGAILFGVVAAKSGLVRRLSYGVMSRLGTSYSSLLLGLIVADSLMTFCVPSGVPRVVIMATIATGLIQAFGVGPGSNIGRGMLLILTYTATVFDKTVIAGAATITARSAIEQFGQVEVPYSQWLLAFLPFDVVIILAAWRLIMWLFPPERPSLPGGTEYLLKELAKMGPWKPAEKKSLALIAAAVALWMTDSLHHISPAIIGLGVGLLALLPPVGILSLQDIKEVNVLLFFFVGSVVSMGNVLGATKGLDVLTGILSSWITPAGDSYFFPLLLYWAGFGYHILLASGVSMLGTSMPALMNYAVTHHLNALALGMIWTLSSSATVFLYQNAVLIVGYSYGFFTARDLFRLGLWMSVINSLLLLLAVPFYWHWIGIAR